MITIVAKNFVGGAWRKGEPELKTLNPAHLDQVVGVANSATQEDVEDAVSIAKNTLEKWNTFGSSRRSDFIENFSQTMRRYSQEMAKYLSLECGFPLTEAQEEVHEAVRASQCIAGLIQFRRGIAMNSCRPGVDVTTWRRPLGVVACFGSWRRPISGPICQILPCLIAGNTVVFKSSEKSLACSQWLSRVFLECGLGEGMVNVLYGGGSSVGDALLRHQDVAAVLIDGKSDSIHAARKVAAEKDDMAILTPLMGENVVIVLEDANIDQAVKLVITSAFRASGQLRTCSRRVLVARSIVDRFTQVMLSIMSQLKIGDGSQPGVSVGPLINVNAVDDYLDRVENLEGSGAEFYSKGARLDEGDLGTGCFVSPTVVKLRDIDDPHLPTTPVGPMIGIYPFDTIEDATEKVNSIGSVQAVSIVTEGTASWRYIRERAKYTAGYVNHPTTLPACFDIESALDAVTSHAVFILGSDDVR